MALTPIWCSGRNWPNAPAQARSGTVGRGPPHFLKIQWNEGILNFAPFNSVPQLLQFAGVPLPGANVFGNWNWIETIAGTNVNFTNQWDGSQFYFRLEFIQADFSGTRKTHFETSRFDWKDWVITPISFFLFVNFTGAQRLIDDPFLTVFPAAYIDLGPGACKSFP